MAESYEKQQKMLQKQMDELLANWDMSDEEPFVGSDEDPDFDCEGESENYSSANDESGPGPSKRRRKITTKRCLSLLGENNGKDSKAEDGIAASLSSDNGSDNDHADVSNIGEWGPLVGNHKNFGFSVPHGFHPDLCATMRGKNELDVYKVFVNDEIFDLMVNQTNIYAEQKITTGIVNETITTKSRLNEWVDTNREEMHTFLGILIWIGLDHKPSLKDYWSRNILYRNGISKIMARNR